MLLPSFPAQAAAEEGPSRYLATGGPARESARFEDFKWLARRNYIEGQNIATGTDMRRESSIGSRLAAEPVRRKLDIILSGIIDPRSHECDQDDSHHCDGLGVDPVDAGMVEARHPGNVTGITNLDGN